MVNFVRYRAVGLGGFIALLSLFCGLYVYRYQTRGTGFLYSIDFTGGTQALIKSSREVSGELLIEALRSGGIVDPVIRQFSPTEFIIRVRDTKDTEDVGGISEKIKSSIEAAITGLSVEMRQCDSVGASLGASLWWSSMRAVFLCLLAMLVYILMRFMSLGFALGAVGSLFHDAVLMLTFCLLVDYEISVQTITAILLVLGYSINDTIIIFARIRENVLKMRSVPLETVVNISLNETLRRTLLTTFSTILVVIPLMIFGGEALRILSSMLLVGFVFGTYSSIYVASPIMLLCTKGSRSA